MYRLYSSTFSWLLSIYKEYRYTSFIPFSVLIFYWTSNLINDYTYAQTFTFHIRRELSDLLAESKYFCISELSEVTEKSLKNLKDKESAEVVPICRVPLITSQKEEQARH